MNAETIIGILTAVIEIILVFSVIRTAENTKEMSETLKGIKYKLDSISNNANTAGTYNQRSTNNSNYYQPSTHSTPVRAGFWVCKCGEQNLNSRTTCSRCGAKKE